MAKGAEEYAEDYTDPELRERLKEKVKASDKGAAKGRWSARKSQLLTTEYEKAGGGYKHPGRRTEAQKDLETWGDQDWQTKGGDADARDNDDTRRYLPGVAWKLMSKSERDATDGKKRKGGEQTVPNTDAAKEARKAAELLDMKAGDARKAVSDMDSKSAPKRARQAEEKYGKGRKTVLEAIDKQLEKV